MLYACDANWWNNANGAPDFAGMKITQDKVALKTFPNLHLVDVVRHKDELLIEVAGRVGWGGNSAFQAINLAVQFGATKLILAGLDMTLKHGVHWHGLHPKGMHNPNDGNVARWRRVIDAASGLLDALKIDVLNVSPISALEAYPKMTLQEALDYERKD